MNCFELLVIFPTLCALTYCVTPIMVRDNIAAKRRDFGIDQLFRLHQNCSQPSSRPTGEQKRARAAAQHSELNFYCSGTKNQQNSCARRINTNEVREARLTSSFAPLASSKRETTARSSFSSVPTNTIEQDGETTLTLTEDDRHERQLPPKHHLRLKKKKSQKLPPLRQPSRKLSADNDLDEQETDKKPLVEQERTVGMILGDVMTATNMKSIPPDFNMTKYEAEQNKTDLTGRSYSVLGSKNNLLENILPETPFGPTNLFSPTYPKYHYGYGPYNTRTVPQVHIPSPLPPCVYGNLTARPLCPNTFYYVCNFIFDYPYALVNEVVYLYKTVLDRMTPNYVYRFGDAYDITDLDIAFNTITIPVTQVVTNISGISSLVGGSISIRQAFNIFNICDTSDDFFRPGWARNSFGYWVVILNNDYITQRIATRFCARPFVACNYQAACFQSYCRQKYTFQAMVAIDPCNIYKGPYLETFRIPTGCECWEGFG